MQEAVTGLALTICEIRLAFPLATAGCFRAQTIWTLAGLSIAMTLLLFVSPLYMLQVYDRVLQSRSGSTLFFLTVIAMGLLVAYSVLDHARGRLLARLGAQFDYALAEPLLVGAVRAGRLQANVNAPQLIADCGKVRDFLGGPGMAALCDLPWAPLFLIICFLVHPLLGCLVAGGAGLVIGLAILSEKRTATKLTEVQAAQIASHASLGALLANADTVHALGMGQALRQRWARLHGMLLDRQIETGDSGGVLSAISKFVRQALQTAMLGAGAWLALDGAITPGMMIAVSIIGGKALTPIDQVVGQWKQLLGARQAYRRVQAFLAMPQKAQPTTMLPAISGRLSATALGLSVPGLRRFIVQDVSFSLEPGETVVVVGPSGAGKSCLLRGLVGATPALSGAVRYDNATLDQWDSDVIGRQIGYLPQRAELFEGTIAENIARFGPAAPQGVQAAAQALGIDELIRKLPNGYDTEIERGSPSLPAGLQQRLALARAFFGNPRVLVLDEPTNGLDYDGRLSLLNALRAAKERGTTIVVVAQDQSIQLLSDKVLVISDGMLRAFRPTREMIVARRPDQSATRPTGTRESDRTPAPVAPIMPLTGRSA